MIKNKNQNIIYLHANNSYGYEMFKFLPTTEFIWIDPREFDLNKYTRNSSKGCILEFDLEYPKQLQELHNDYPLAPVKQKSKEKCCLSIADLCNIPIGIVKKIMPNFFDKQEYVLRYVILQFNLCFVFHRYVLNISIY